MALWTAIKAIDIGPGGEVITPSLTFTSVPSVIRALGAKPVFVDVEHSSRNVDIYQLAGHVT